jgi:hypothetical protein
VQTNQTKQLALRANLDAMARVKALGNTQSGEGFSLILIAAFLWPMVAS